jgi:hypothetical protein
VVFPGHTNHFTTASWIFDKEEFPFVPVNDEAIPFMMKRNLRKTFAAMLQDTVAYKNAYIKVENMRGPILLISVTKDKIAPTTPITYKMIARLKETNFKGYKQHIAIERGHKEPLHHFDEIFKFLDQHFPAQ